MCRHCHHHRRHRSTGMQNLQSNRRVFLINLYRFICFDRHRPVRFDIWTLHLTSIGCTILCQVIRVVSERMCIDREMRGTGDVRLTIISLVRPRFSLRIFIFGCVDFIDKIRFFFFCLGHSQLHYSVFLLISAGVKLLPKFRQSNERINCRDSSAIFRHISDFDWRYISFGGPFFSFPFHS